MALSEDLYKDIIIEYSQNPRHFGEPDGCEIHEEGVNRSCGDEVTLHLSVEDGRITKAGFTGKGCSISTASAEMLTTFVVGLTVDEARHLIQEFKGMVIENRDPHFPDAMEDLESLRGVVQYPVRVKCATLSWNTLEQALATR